MQRKKIIKILSVLISILAIVTLIAAIVIKTSVNNELERQKKEQEAKEAAINYATKITIKDFITNFNNEVTNRKQKYLLNNEYLKVENGTYYFGIFDDIGLYIIPLEYTGNQEKDIVKTTSIFYPSNSKNKEMAFTYVNSLVKTNLPDKSEDDIKLLLYKTAEESKNNKALDENNGMFISYNEKENNVFYIISRHYKK